MLHNGFHARYTARLRTALPSVRPSPQWNLRQEITEIITEKISQQMTAKIRVFSRYIFLLFILYIGYKRLGLHCKRDYAYKSHKKFE